MGNVKTNVNGRIEVEGKFAYIIIDSDLSTEMIEGIFAECDKDGDILDYKNNECWIELGDASSEAQTTRFKKRVSKTFNRLGFKISWADGNA